VDVAAIALNQQVRQFSLLPLRLRFSRRSRLSLWFKHLATHNKRRSLCLSHPSRSRQNLPAAAKRC
jgi:hypothetical protein